ncbi:ABC transporter ATP-binding protein [Prauserella oleivorans]|uniref:ABC transporter ATP-binding protein n=1 Tax=Prauserella oleivorans TaxID=1478153 RepID=UPI0036105C1B
MPSTVSENDGIVTLVDVAVDVERVPVLRGLDLTVAAGESIGVVGANGSGKSTLLRVLATLLPPVGGHGRVLGAELGTDECFAVRPGIALVGHAPALYPRLTLGENLRFLARLTGRRERAVDEALEAVGLARAADRRAEVCSQGMLRRAELARVLLSQPRLLLLDEAHAGLDKASISLVEAVVERVRDGAGASVVVSHDQPRLRGVADRLIEISSGQALPVGEEVPA